MLRGKDELDSGVVTLRTPYFMMLITLFRTGMAGIPGTASAIFSAVKDVGANVVMISQVHLSTDSFCTCYCYDYMIFNWWLYYRLAVSIQCALLCLRKK